VGRGHPIMLSSDASRSLIFGVPPINHAASQKSHQAESGRCGRKNTSVENSFANHDRQYDSNETSEKRKSIYPISHYRNQTARFPGLDLVPPVFSGEEASCPFINTRTLDSLIRIVSYTQSVFCSISSPASCSASSSASLSNSNERRFPSRQSRICRIASGRRTFRQYCRLDLDLGGCQHGAGLCGAGFRLTPIFSWGARVS
jgi:hypothetical protein